MPIRPLRWKYCVCFIVLGMNAICHYLLYNVFTTLFHNCVYEGTFVLPFLADFVTPRGAAPIDFCTWRGETADMSMNMGPEWAQSWRPPVVVITCTCSCVPDKKAPYHKSLHVLLEVVTIHTYPHTFLFVQFHYPQAKLRFRCLNVYQYETNPSYAAKKCMKWWAEQTNAHID